MDGMKWVEKKKWVRMGWSEVRDELDTVEGNEVKQSEKVNEGWNKVRDEVG